MVDGFLNFDTRISTKGFDKGLDSIGKRLNSLKGTVKNIMAALGIAFSAGKAIEYAANVKAVNSQLTQTFKEFKTFALEAIQAVADSSGILRTRLDGTANSIYAFAKASGMDSATALNMMSDALQVAADSAAYYDRSLEDMSDTLMSYLKGNYANDAALGISSTETTRNIAANKLYAKSFSELSEAQKQLTLLQMVKDANKLSGAEGQAAREAEGWENVIGNLKEAWKQLLAVVGQPVLHVAIDVVKALTSALVTLTEKASSAVGALSELFGWEEDETASVSANISESVDSQNNLTEAVKETTEAEKKSLASFDEVNTISSNSSDAVTAQTTVQTTVEPVSDTGESEKKVNALVEKIQKYIKPIKLAWEDNSPQLLENIRYTVDSAKGLIKSIGESLSEVWLNGSGERFVGNVITSFSDLFGLIGDFNTALKNAWDDEGRGTALIQSYADKWNAILELLHVIADTYRTAWNDGTGESILGNILEIFTNINDTISNISTNLAEAWSNHGTDIWSGILSIFNTILSTVNRITLSTSEWSKNIDFNPLLSSVSGFLEKLDPLFTTVGDIFADVYENVLLPFGKWVIEDAVPVSIDVFSGAIALLTAVIDALKPMVKWLWDNFLSPIAKWTGGIIVTVLEDIATALEGISDWITKHQKLVQNFVFLVGTLGAALKIASIIKTATAAFTAMGGIMGVLTTITGGLSAAMGVLAGIWSFITSPITLVCLAIGAVIAIGVLLIKHWDELKVWAVNTWANILGGILGFLDNIKIFLIRFGAEILKIVFETIDSTLQIIKGLGETALDFLTGIGDAIKKGCSAVGDWIVTKFKKAKDNVTNTWKNVGSWFGDRWKDTKDALKDVSEWFKNKFNDARDNTNKAFEKIGSWFGDRWKETQDSLSNVSEWFKKMFNDARNFTNSAFETIGSWFGDRWTDIQNKLSNVAEWFRSIFQSAWDNITLIFSNPAEFFDNVRNAIQNCFSGIADWFGNTFRGAWQAVKDVFTTGGEIFHGITDSIAETFKGCVNAIIGGLNNVISDPFRHINRAFDRMRQWEIMDIHPFSWLPDLSVPEIPYLAQGTVVPANYGNFLAVLGDNKREPEIVSPVSSMKKALREVMAEGGGSGPKEVVIYTYLYPNSAAFHREVVKIVDDNDRRKGA